MSRSPRSHHHHPELRTGETSRAQQDFPSHLRLILPLPAPSSSRTRSGPPPGSLDAEQPHSATTTETPASLEIPSPSTTNGEPGKRGRGRPRTKEVVLGPKRPRGRPRKVLVVETGPPAPAKPRGRPRKDKDAAGEFRVRVSAHNGPITVPGVKGHLHRPHLQPLAPLFSNQRQALHGNMPAPAPASIPSTPISHNTQPRSGPSVHIAPEEDPEGPVDIDEDEETEASGKGIGEETTGGDEADEGDDEREHDGDEPSVNPHARHSHPPWLLEHFRTCVQALQIRDADGLPALYAKGRTFWFRSPEAWFLLQSSPSPVRLYKPQMFVWDPLALYKKLPCPRCNRVLSRHSTISQPRRCVDLTATFWIVGFRYRCRNCKHPKTGKSTVTWRSWDPRILAVMPRALSAQFPARLTHRSAISNDLFSWMRSCFQNGMGSGQFADAVLAQHLLRYDQLHLQYLDFIAQGVAVSEFTDRKYKSFLPFDDASPEGFRGFVPSARYFRDVYDTFMDEHRHHFDQHTAMLSAIVCALDHSHKLPKRIATVDHLPVFGALLCFTNEKGEIRALNFVATKAHSQYELTLKGIRESLELYGHESIKIVYTDNVTDRAFLESSFPSLRTGVVPVEKYSHLPLFSLPDGVQPLVRHDESAINVAMSTILAHAPVEEAEGDLAIGFDCEWNVGVLGGGPGVERGEIAVIQIAFENRVYVLQVSKMIEHRRLPEKLVMLLQNPRVRKVGRMVAGDLKQLEDIVKPSSPFSGDLDLAAYAKERNVVSNARISLSDLCAIVLGKMLRKNVSERFSMAWEQDILTDEQVQYAACDAYAPLLIYQELSKLRVPQPLPSVLPAQSTVNILLYNQDRSTVLASGHLSPRPFPIEFDKIHLTPTRALVTITEVRVPGALLTLHHDRPLSSFGPPPFQVVCKRTFLRMYDPLSFKLPEPPQPMSVDAATPVRENNEMDQQEGEGESLAESEKAYETDQGAGSLLRQSMGAGGEVSERLGILPIPDGVRIASAIGEYNPQDPGARKQEQAYLARIQNTKKAVLPVHTPQEYKLFEELMVSSSAFNSTSRGPVWKLAVRVWNERAELTHGISYKLVEHLKTCYASFNVGIRIRQTLSTTSTIRRDINKRARDPRRSDAAPQLMDRPLAPTMVTAGLDIPSNWQSPLPSPPCPPPPTPTYQDTDSPPDFESTSAPTHQTPPTFAYPATAHALAQRRVAEDIAQRQQQPPAIIPPTPTLPPQHPPTTFSDAARELARQRVASSVAQRQPQPAAPSGPRGPRKCQKCGSAECSGRKQIKFCYNPCQDCGEILCYGRNSRRTAGKPCNLAWIGYEDRRPELPTLPPPPRTCT
ncbi:hypothetical protein D9611_008540 [Ephemerocybe angulata]|uniref:3'-5' exonuclease n=1 Tax=Ephemerocybe angulata TaxID=980116 RepID=A0A8H5AYW0_9AGAR|nr:hypothetical protein D9611_008539 [Tulosesus angulatus]KAF5313503.1 hypothetical protein D9611_008540 [Tulosesus angulatus]